ncbi:MAG: response regulator [Cyanobacteria bacterium J06626_14]
MDINNCSVLLVEDDSNDILLIQRAFQKVGTAHLVQIVKDGDAAVEYLAGVGEYSDRDRDPLPSLVLLDLKLPRRSGIEILEWMKQQPAIKRIPVVVLTSSKESLDVNRSYDLGVNSYLVKPVSFSALTSMIDAISTYWFRLNEYPSTPLET